jgi:hypothetical protein
MHNKTFDAIKLLVDYSLTFAETYTSSPFDVLHACISIYVDKKNLTSGYLIELSENVSPNAQTLKDLFTSSIISESSE